jgi:flagellar protein FlbD
MIILTKLNDKSFVLNSDLIEIIEDTPDTVITLSSGKKYVVKETVDECIDRIVEYKRRIFIE